MFHRKNLLYIISRIFHIKFRLTRSLELYLNIFVKYNEKNHKRNLQENIDHDESITSKFECNYSFIPPTRYPVMVR